MVLASEAILFIYGIVVLVRGKMDLGSDRVLRGAFARVCGFMGVVPLGFGLSAGFVLGIVLGASGRQPTRKDTAALSAVEFLIFGVCLILTFVLASVFWRIQRRRDDGAAIGSEQPNPGAERPSDN